MIITVRRYWKLAVTVAATLIAGLTIGFVIAAPTVTDLRNACNADQVARTAGLRPGATPGPPVSTLPQTAGQR